MAEEKIEEKVILEVDTGQSITTIKELRQAVKEARAEFISAEEGTEGYEQALQKVVKLRTTLTNATKLGTILANEEEESYNTLSATLSELTIRYKNLGDTAERAELAERIAGINTQLKEMDTTRGVFTRFVGQYENAAKGFTPLQFQIQQVARELPSLTMSFNQFFLAISNNLPLLADEFKRTSGEVARLRAEGQQVPSAFSQALKAVFSWQTLLVVGITLLASYGKEIIQWGKDLITGAGRANSAEKAARGLNDAIKDGYDDVAGAIYTLRDLQRQWDETGGNLEEKQRIVESNADAFERLGLKVEDVEGAENLLVKNTDAFIESMKLRAQAAAAQELAIEQYRVALQEQQKADEKIKKGKKETIVTYTDFGIGPTPTRKEVKREYTDEEAEGLRKDQRSAEALADAYFNLKRARDAAADAALKNSGITELASEANTTAAKASEDAAKRQQEIAKANYEAELELMRLRQGNRAANRENDLQTLQENYDTELAAFNTHVENERIAQETADAIRLEMAERFRQQKSDINARYDAEELSAFEEELKAEIDAEHKAGEQAIKEGDRQYKAKRKLDKAEEKAERDKQKLIGNLIAAGAELAGENTAFGKAVAVASTTVSTWQSAQEAYRSQFNPPTTSSPARGAIAAAAAVASGMANIRNILSVQVPKSPLGSGSGIGGIGAGSGGSGNSAPAVIQQVPVTRTLTSDSEETRLNNIETNTNRAAQDQRVVLVWSDVEEAARTVEIQHRETSF